MRRKEVRVSVNKKNGTGRWKYYRRKGKREENNRRKARKGNIVTRKEGRKERESGTRR